MVLNKFGLFEDVINYLTKEQESGPKKYINEDKNITAFSYTLPAHFSMEEHFHDWIEFTLVIKGEQKIIVKEKEYILRNGDFLMINYNDIHYSITLKETEKVTMQFKMGVIEKMIPEFDSAQILCSTSQIKNSYDYYSYLSIVELYTYMYDSFCKRSLHPQANFYGYLFLFFYRIMKECMIQSTYQNMNIENNTYIDQIISYINRHYNDHLTLDVLSKELHLTPQYISKIIKEETGRGFKEYLVQLRLDYAKSLIINTDKNLLTICQECGFSNNKSFIYYFKQEYGMTPSQYRKECQ